MKKVNAAREQQAEHNRELKQLALKYIGTKRLELGYKTKYRRQWVLDQIRTLTFEAGRVQQKSYKCKFGSRLWFEYSQTSEELLQLVDHLELELLERT